jgi:hypothetical protein
MQYRWAGLVQPRLAPSAPRSDAVTQSWSDDRSAAIHQAGHAVTAFKLGKPIEHLTILPDKDHFGCVKFSYPYWFTPDREVAEPIWALIEDQVLIWLAGFAAEDSWCQDGPDKPDDRNARLTVGADSDLRAVATMAEHIGPGTLEGRIEELRQRVLQWVGPKGAYSSLVYQLADELATAQQLSGLDAELFLTLAEAEVGGS